MFTKKTPEEKAAHEEKKKQKARQREIARKESEKQRKIAERKEEEMFRAAEFARTPAGQARAAKEAGAQLFQIDIPLSVTKAKVVTMVGAFAKTGKSQDHASMLDSIEAEGWKLEHANYVYRLTGSQSRDKFLASGQDEAFKGETVGIYIFRVATKGRGTCAQE